MLGDLDYPDARHLTPEEQFRVLWTLHHALIELRALCWDGQMEQAAQLADVFHNIPMLVASDHFSLDTFRYGLGRYQEAYAHRQPFDYLDLLERGLDACGSPPPDPT